MLTREEKRKIDNFREWAIDIVGGSILFLTFGFMYFLIIYIGG